MKPILTFAIIIGILLFALGHSESGLAAEGDIAALPNNISIITSEVPGEAFTNFITTITPAINLAPTTYGSNGKGGSPNPGSFHLLYFIDRTPPSIGKMAVADTFEILGVNDIERIGDSIRAGPRQILEGIGRHTLTAAVVSDDNIIRAIGGSIKFSVNASVAPSASASVNSDSNDGISSVIAMVAIIWLFLLAPAVTVLLTWQTVRRRRKIKLELDSADPFRLATGRGIYRLYVTSGRVKGYHRELETKIHVSTSTTYYSAPSYVSSDFEVVETTRASTTTNVTSRTITHDQFFVVDGKGPETPVHLIDWNIELRDDQAVSVVRAIPEGANEGPYILLRNHSSNWSNWSVAFFRDVEVPSKSKALGCIMLFVGWPFFFVPLFAMWMQKRRAKRVLSGFLPAGSPRVGGLAPLIRALDAAKLTNPL